MSLNPNPTEAYNEILRHLHEEHRYRSIPALTSGKHIDLLSNDYLGLAREADTYKEEFARRFPDAAFTSSASRLLSRANTYHNRLEKYLEHLYRRPTLLFNSGYHANVGILQALAIPGTLFLADKLVHASALDGLRLSGADFKRFPHNDMKKLRMLIERNRKDYDRIIIVVEGIYSMDGDVAPLREIVKLKRRFPGVMIYLDEAHSFGVRGRRGLGLAEELGLIPDIDIIMATLGKAAASVGAFVVTSSAMKDYLVNTARSLIFSTAMPPAQAAWSMLMIEKIVGMEERRLHLKDLSSKFVKKLSDRLNFESPATTQIVPLIIGDPSETLLMARYLGENGFDSLAIRRPTVPAGSERLRFSLNALLTEEDIDRFIDVLGNYK